MLKKTGVRLELLTDLDIHHFIERGMQSGISLTSKKENARKRVDLGRGLGVLGGALQSPQQLLRDERRVRGTIAEAAEIGPKMYLILEENPQKISRKLR